MTYALENQHLAVKVDSLGGEITSLCAPSGPEYLWQPDPAYWKKQAPHLFPLVGRLTDGIYTLDGTAYQTDTHGFFRWKEMQLEESGENTLVLAMESDEDTMAQYPRRWGVRLCYRLHGATLEIDFAVKNRDGRPLYFAYGGHPGFRVPLEEGLVFEDYYLQFEKDALPVQVGFSDACYVQGPNRPLALDENARLPLRHGLFDKDAVVLKQAGKSVSLCSAKGPRQVTVRFGNLPYLGLWHAPGTDAPYVCIEPWTSLPARQNVVEALEEKADMICLAPKKRWRTQWTITCE